MSHHTNRARAWWSSLLVAAFAAWAGVGASQVSPPPPQPPGRPGPPPTGTGMVAGRVVDGDSGEGIPGATVTITLRGGRGGNAVFVAMASTVLTDSQGRFVFGALPAAQASINAQRDGYSNIIGQRMIDLGDGARITDYLFRLSKLNTILGTVRDDAGDPVVGTDVLAFARTAQSGRSPSFTVRNRSRTNDRGEYRLVNLPADQYWICACTRDPIPFDGQLLSTLASRPLDLLSIAKRAAVAGASTASLDSTLSTYAPTFFPSTPLASRAERVAVEKGEVRSAVDITVTTVRGVRVAGQVIGLPPSSISAGSLRLVPLGDIPEAASITQLPPMLVQPDGRFDFAGVPPGTYTLELNTVVGRGSSSPSGAALAFVGPRQAPPPPPPPPPPAPGSAAVPQPDDIRWATEIVTVGEDDVVGLVVAAQPGISVRGRVVIPGMPNIPNASGVMQLMPVETRAGRPNSYGAQLSSDLSFTFVVPPGRYVVPGSALGSITAKGRDVSDEALVVDGDIQDLIMTRADLSLRPSLSGTAQLPGGEVPEEWIALVFPSDRRLWREPVAALRRFVSAPITGQRTFTASLPPGDYLVALDKVRMTAGWMEASALEELAKTATAVTLVEGDKKSVTVKR